MEKSAEEKAGRRDKGGGDGYYEIAMNGRYLSQMPAAALAGNVIYHRMHWHGHLEVMCCLKGSFSLRAGGEILHLSEGDFAAINPDVPHEIFDGQENGLQIIYSVDAGLLRKENAERYRFATVGPDALPEDCPEVWRFRRSVARIAWMITPERNEVEAYMREREAARDIRDSYGMDVFHGAESRSGLEGQRKPEDQAGQKILFSREEDWYAYQREVYESLWCLVVTAHLRQRA